MLRELIFIRDDSLCVAWRLSTWSANAKYPRSVGRNSEVAARTGLVGSHKTPFEFCLQSHRQAFRRYASSTPSTPVSCWSDRLSAILPSTAGSVVQVVRTTDRSTSSTGTTMTPPADLWRRSIMRGHTGVTLRSSTTTRWQRRRRLAMFWAWCSVFNFSSIYTVWFFFHRTSVYDFIINTRNSLHHVSSHFHAVMA